MRKASFLEKVYEPVLKYRTYLEILELSGMEILEVTGGHMFMAAEIGSEEGLLITDVDFFQIEGVLCWKP